MSLICAIDVSNRLASLPARYSRLDSMISSILADASFIGFPWNNAENVLPLPGSRRRLRMKKPEVHSREQASFALTGIARTDAFAEMRMQFLRCKTAAASRRTCRRSVCKATRARSSAAAAGFSKGYPLGARYM